MPSIRTRGIPWWPSSKKDMLMLYWQEMPLQPTIWKRPFSGPLLGRTSILRNRYYMVIITISTIGYEDMKIIEALEFLKAVVEGRRFRPDFGDALANASVSAAMIRSWASGRWEDVVSLRIEGEGA